MTWQTITLGHDDTLDTAAPRQGQAGNLTNDGLFQYTYDAWNRLVGAWYAGGDVADADQRVARYEYDGLFRRVEKQTANRGSWFVHGSTAGGADGIVDGSIHQHYYYAGWRLVEMTTGTDTLGQWVWGVQYIDEAVVYDRNTDYTSDDDCLDAGSARYTYSQDANFRVVGLTNESGAVVERYEYTAYGEPAVEDGVRSGSLELGNATFVSSVGNPFMHQGLFRDSEIGGYQNRVRTYDSRLGSFVQRDPIGYADGLGLYQSLRSNPFAYGDPVGLACVSVGVFPCHDEGPSPSPGKQLRRTKCGDSPAAGEAADDYDESFCYNDLQDMIDKIKKLSSELAEKGDSICELHILDHGDAAYQKTGHDFVDTQRDEGKKKVRALGEALGKNAKIFLEGCWVGLKRSSMQDGEEYVQSVADLTGLEVTAWTGRMLVPQFLGNPVPNPFGRDQFHFGDEVTRFPAGAPRPSVPSTPPPPPSGREPVHIPSGGTDVRPRPNGPQP